MKRILLMASIMIIMLCYCISVAFADETNLEKQCDKLEEYLIPKTEQEKVDFNSMEINDHQYLAYCLKAEVRRGNTEIAQQLTQYLVDHADENKDGEIGWGLGFAWDAFGDGTVNPEWHVYAIETINVMDAFTDALESGFLDGVTSNIVKEQLHDIVMIWNQKYWTENKEPDGKYFYWYSISEEDEIGCINIDAKMIGVQAKVLYHYGEMFAPDERDFVCKHLDQCYAKIMQESFFNDGVLVWNYLERPDSQQNDIIHHGFILEGINDYIKYRIGGEIPENDIVYGEFIMQCLEGDKLFSNAEHSSNRCFDTGAIRWIKNKELQKRVLLSSYDVYANSETDRRQLAFLFDAMSLYLVEEM